MPVVFNSEGFPTCCGRVLPARIPTTYCPICYHTYNTDTIMKDHNNRKAEWKEYAPTAKENSNES